jgi:hypothetical protein
MGGIDEINRANGLHQLRALLNAIDANWKEVEYMSTTALVECMRKSKQS